MRFPSPHPSPRLHDPLPHAPLPHDLLRIADGDSLCGDAPAPDWVSAALAAAPWVVVRRAASRQGAVAVGVRGGERHQRWAAWLEPAAILERRTPDALTACLSRLPPQRRTAIPALAALPRLADALTRLGLGGGPTGSVGFELASGQATATVSSDLDAVVRADRRLDRAIAADLLRIAAGLGVRCDILLETPGGGVALGEYARGGAVALRTPDGPRLVADPWASTIEESLR